MDKKLEEISVCLPPALRSCLSGLSPPHQQDCEELRLRTGQPLYVSIRGKEHAFPERIITSEDVRQVLERAADYSIHTHTGSMRQGFLTVRGGHRIGICGEAASENGTLQSFRYISSLNIRIARQISCPTAEELIRSIVKNDIVYSSLILSPPGRGKTTLLRDMAKRLSNAGIRTAVADERSEIAALYHGMPQLDVGTHTDVLSGCPKAEAAMMLVKTMSPQLLILDELTSEKDIRAAEYASHCGVAVLASAHAWDWEDFCLRPLYQKLWKQKIFSHLFQIEPDRSITKIP